MLIDKYWCNDCKQAFDADKAVKKGEHVGDEIRGGWVDWDTCPNCGSEYLDEALKCYACDNWVNETYGWGGKNLCQDCIDKAGTTDNLLEYGNSEKEKVEINCFLAGIYSEEQINFMLRQRYLESLKSGVDEKELKHKKAEFLKGNDDFAYWYFYHKKL